jgi:hypothetical protein
MDVLRVSLYTALRLKLAIVVCWQVCGVWPPKIAIPVYCDPICATTEFGSVAATGHTTFPFPRLIRTSGGVSTPLDGDPHK